VALEEKKAWIYTALAVIIPGLYAIVVFGQLGSTRVEAINYAQPLFIAIGLAIGLTILGTILLSIVSGHTSGKLDEREREIARRSDLIGYYVLSAGIVGALVLVCTNQPHFWIANAIYGAFILSAVVSSIVKLVAYRRGF
jgi:hypothetical protein